MILVPKHFPEETLELLHNKCRFGQILHDNNRQESESEMTEGFKFKNFALYAGPLRPGLATLDTSFMHRLRQLRVIGSSIGSGNGSVVSKLLVMRG